MIKFSWEKINNKLSWNAHDVLSYFYKKEGFKSPANRNNAKKVEAMVKLPYPKGPCFLKNPEPLFKEQHDPNHVYIYLELASKRNLFDYSMRGSLFLPIELIPEYLMGLIEHNPLLKIENDKLYFKYEQEKQYDY